MAAAAAKVAALPAYLTGAYMTEAVRVSKLQRLGLAAGAAAGAFMNPWRDDLVATMLEVFSRDDLRTVYRRMLSVPEGRHILREKPMISTETVSLPALRNLPKNTFGYKYVTWMDKEKVGPDTRRPIRFIDDPELAYLVLRVRQCHDFFHVMVNMPTDGPGEHAVKLFEAGQLHITGPLLGGVFGPFAVKSEKKRNMYLREYLPVILKNIQPAHRQRLLLTAYFEKRFEQDIEDFRREFNIIPYVERAK